MLIRKFIYKSHQKLKSYVKGWTHNIAFSKNIETPNNYNMVVGQITYTTYPKNMISS